MPWPKYFALFIALILPSFGYSKTITLASDEWCPYICNDSNAPGYVVELTKTALQQAGFQVHFQQMPLSRAISLSSKGEVDAILGLSAEHILTYQLQSNSVAVGSFSYDYFVRQGYDWRYQGDQSLKELLRQGGRLGLIKDYLYSDLVARLEAGFPNHVFRAHGNHPLRSLIGMANKNRLDVIIDSYNTVNYLTKTAKQSPLIFVGSEKQTYPIFIGFSHSVPFPTIQKLDQQLENILASDELKILLKKYHVKNWRLKTSPTED